MLNLFGGVLTFKRKAEEALEASGMPYTIVRPGENCHSFPIIAGFLFCRSWACRCAPWCVCDGWGALVACTASGVCGGRLRQIAAASQGAAPKVP